MVKDESLKNYNILFIEDMDITRNIMHEVLGHFFKEVYTAIDGADALSKCIQHEGEIDLIVTDIEMPNMTGIELAKLVREKRPNLPIVFLSAFSDSEYIEKAKEIGIEYYLVKPVKAEDIIRVAKESLGIENN